jgi:predicted nucleotidyltransferase
MNRRGHVTTKREVAGAERGADAALREIVRRLVEAYRPQQVYLFGSHARGESNEDSDYDLMVVVPDDAPEDRRQSRLAYQVLRGTGVAADVLVWTREEFDARIPLKASLPAAVVTEGRLVYEA